MRKIYDKVSVGVLMAVIFTAIASANSQQTLDKGTILNSLLQPPNGFLVGYKITASETNTIFTADASGSKSIPQTNICIYVYRFGDGVVSISCQRYDLSGGQVKETRTMVVNNEIWESNKSVEEKGSNPASASGTIEPLGASLLYGVPAFLSKSLLREFIEKSPSAAVEIGSSSKGQNCYIVKITTPPKSFVDSYRLCLNLKTLLPIEFTSYLADGTVCSETDLKFDESGDDSFFCKASDAIIFSGGEIAIHSGWRRIKIERGENLPQDGQETFFEAHTRVTDHRFSKPISYHKGRRMPTPDEITQMIASPAGVAKYEAASAFGGFSPEVKIARAKTSWPILLLLVCLAGGPLVYLVFRRKDDTHHS